MTLSISYPQTEACLLKISTGDIPYTLCRSPRRRTVTLAINESGKVKLSIPAGLAEAEAHKFIFEKRDWLLRKLQHIQTHQGFLSRRCYADGGTFHFLGREFPLRTVATENRRLSVAFDGEAWQIHIPHQLEPQQKKDVLQKELAKWFREQAKEIFPGRIFHYGRIMGLDPKHIAVKTQRRSWGSCSTHRRSIHLNWQLVMAPVEVLDYVVVHELAHLMHPNHSRRFWRKVETFMPDYQERRKWLQENRWQMILP